MKKTKQHIILFISVASFFTTQASNWIRGATYDIFYPIVKRPPNTSQHAFSLYPSKLTVPIFGKSTVELEYPLDKYLKGICLVEKATFGIFQRVSRKHQLDSKPE